MKCGSIPSPINYTVVKTIKLYQVDAFTSQLFGGNPAAVCVLETWLSDVQMQGIAAENNLAETAFVVRTGVEEYSIRWFTPAVEVDLCGHATLASAYILFQFYEKGSGHLTFQSMHSGTLGVSKVGELLTLDFPADTYRPAAISTELIEGIGFAPIEVFQGKADLMLVMENEEQVLSIRPNFVKIASAVGIRGVIVTAPGDRVDFVSRFFAPQAGIPEDPVTGSAHTTLAPYWAKRLGKDTMQAIQLSARKGHLTCRINGDRVEISGNAVLYMSGEIFVE